MPGRPKPWLAMRERLAAWQRRATLDGIVRRHDRRNGLRHGWTAGRLKIPLVVVCVGALAGYAAAISWAPVATPLQVAMAANISYAQDTGLTGRASVVDGDSIEIRGQPVRLWGIDAPELAQPCTRGGKPWHCGREAAQALAGRLSSRAVACETRTRDQYGRIVALCRVDGDDVSTWLVEQGWALAFRRFSLDYVAHEDRARAARRGVWSGEFQPPWEWRERQRPGAAGIQGAATCPIKGNISDRGERIYHVPGGQYYDRTTIDASRGERWFCSEADARAAGWRRSYR